MTTVIRGKKHHGLFSILYGALRGIRECELDGTIPSVTWGEECAYYEPGNGENCWEAFFHKTGNPGTVVKEKTLAGWDDIPVYPGKSLYETLHVLVSKCAIPNTSIMEECTKYDIQDCIGIHYRGTDKVATQEFAGPSPEVFCAHALTACTNMGINRVFVATDCGRAMETFETWARVNEIELIKTHCIRSFNSASIHNHYGLDTGKATSKHGNTKGVEVLIDALLLSRCKHIIRSPSGVSLFAILWNPDLTYECLGALYKNHDWESFILDRKQHIKKHVTFKPISDIYVVNRDTVAGKDIFDYIQTNPPNEEPYVWITTGLTAPTSEDLETVLETKHETLFTTSNHEMHLMSYILTPQEIEIVSAIMESKGLRNASEIISSKMIITLPGQDQLMLCCSRSILDLVWSCISVILRGDVQVKGETYALGERKMVIFMAFVSILAGNIKPLP
jgi:hypothetical protein